MRLVMALAALDMVGSWGGYDNKHGKVSQGDAFPVSPLLKGCGQGVLKQSMTLDCKESCLTSYSNVWVTRANCCEQWHSITGPDLVFW